MKSHVINLSKPLLNQNFLFSTQPKIENIEAADEKNLKPVTYKTSKIISCIAYGAVSVSITLFNKTIFSFYKFQYPAFMTLLQVGLSIFFMIILGKTRFIDFEMEGGGGCGILGGLRWTIAKKVFPLAFFWMLYVQSGVIALRYLTVPMFSALRRSTSFVTVLGEYVAFGKVTPFSSLAAIFVMVAGSAVAGATDLSFNATGYAWVGVCVFSTAAFLILIRTVGKELELNQHALLLYNNVLSLPMMLLWFVFATDEPENVFSAPQWRDPSFVAFLLVSASQAFLLNVCTFWCTTVNSALVTTIVGQMKDLATTFLGLFIFGDVLFDAINLLGIGLGLSGGIAYATISHTSAQHGR